MRYLNGLLKVASAAFFVACATAALAQTGTVTNHAFTIGKGAGVTGYTSLLCTSAQLAVGQAAADPICRTLSGDVTIDASGVTAIGTAKVTAGMIAGMTSAQLRTILSDEVGTGAAYFVGGALGTPASGTLTNATGLPVGGIAAISANTMVANATAGSASPTAVAVPSCSGANQAINWTSGTGPGCATIAGAGGTVGPSQPQIRLTLTQGTPVTTADVTAGTSLYLEPYNGNQMAVYDGVSAWTTLTVAASTYSLPATQTQTCTLASSVNVTGCTDTSQMVVGQQVTGTNIPGSDTIAAIPTSTTLTLSGAATGSGATSLTFKFPPNSNYDVYGISNGGVPKLVPSAVWSNDTTPGTARVLQDGVEVASGATTKRLLGSIRTTSVAGQLEDSHTHRWVSNRYNEQPRPMYATDPAASWAYSTATTRQANANTANQLDYIACVARPIWATAQAQAVNNTGTNNVNVGIGIDSTSGSSAQLVQLANLSGTTYVATTATYTGTPGLGRHYVPWLEFGGGTNTQTWLGTAANNISGIMGEVAN